MYTFTFGYAPFARNPSRTPAETQNPSRTPAEPQPNPTRDISGQRGEPGRRCISELGDRASAEAE